MSVTQVKCVSLIWTLTSNKHSWRVLCISSSSSDMTSTWVIEFRFCAISILYCIWVCQWYRAQNGVIHVEVSLMLLLVNSTKGTSSTQLFCLWLQMAQRYYAKLRIGGKVFLSMWQWMAVECLWLVLMQEQILVLNWLVNFVPQSVIISSSILSAQIMCFNSFCPCSSNWISFCRCMLITFFVNQPTTANILILANAIVLCRLVTVFIAMHFQEKKGDESDILIPSRR